MKSASAKAGVLWVGGTSDLTRTFVEELEVKRPLYLAAPFPPTWPLVENTEFLPLDLTCSSSVATLKELLKLRGKIDTLIFGARASLVWDTSGHMKLTSHMKTLLNDCIDAGVRAIVHVSSVAVVNHLQQQIMGTEDDELPPLSEYRGQYDMAKRAAEEIITKVCEERGIRCVHLRLSGIFSNPGCIQMASLGLQRYIGCYVKTKIDFNSSKNVGCAIQLISERLRAERADASAPAWISRVYYYTRPTTEDPCIYGAHLKEFRKVHGITVGVWLPLWVMGLGIWCIQTISSLFGGNSFLEALAYLSAVCENHHTFDNTRFKTEFKEIVPLEESIVECFERVQKRYPGR